MSAPILPEREHAVLCDALRECSLATWRMWGDRGRGIESNAHRRDVQRALLPLFDDGFVSFGANGGAL